jgi:putative nucleotidyltransferase with HDIG domain
MVKLVYPLTNIPYDWRSIMKLTFVSNLEGTEILAKNILSDDGKTLLKAGTKLTKEFIGKLKNYGIFFVYINHDMLGDITDDKKLNELKEEALKTLPNIFNDLINRDEKNLKNSLLVVGNLVDHIIETGNININLYEVKTYDNYTYIHSVDTCIMASFIGMSINLNKNELKELAVAAILHDIGKTKISNEIINKKTPLTNAEFFEIKKHTIYGEKILRTSNTLSDCIIKSVLQHHERIDGKGYPYGITGNLIHKFTKIISISDVYTAVSANRSYRDRFTPSEAYELILSGSGTMFDSELVSNFRKTFAIYPLGCCIRLSNGMEGFVVKQNKYFPDKPIVRIIYDSQTSNPLPYYEIDLLTNLNLVIESVVID